MKRKFLLPILSVCMVVALVSVGFAAWLITGSDTNDTAEGSFVTDGVRNEFFTVTIDPYDGSAITETSPEIVFGKPSGYKAKDTDWFKPNDDVKDESLTAKFLVKITPDDQDFLKKDDEDGAQDGILEKYQITITLKEDGSGNVFDDLAKTDKTNIGTMVKDNGGKTVRDGNAKTSCAYVSAPTFKASTYSDYDGNATMNDLTAKGNSLTSGYVLTLGGGNFKVTDDGASASCIIEITFNWGNYFTLNKSDTDTIVNPYEYFNTFDSKDATSVTIEGSTMTTQGALNRKAAYDVMDAIKKLNTVKFNLSLDASEIPEDSD